MMEPTDNSGELMMNHAHSASAASTTAVMNNSMVTGMVDQSALVVVMVEPKSTSSTVHTLMVMVGRCGRHQVVLTGVMVMRTAHPAHVMVSGESSSSRQLGGVMMMGSGGMGRSGLHHSGRIARHVHSVKVVLSG